MEERKINIDREPITSAEIATRKDFQNVLSGATPPGITGGKPPFYKTGWFGTTVAGIAIVVTTTLATIMLSEEDPLKDHVLTNNGPFEDPIAYNEDTPCVTSLLEEQDVKYASYVVNADEGGTITHTTGSELNIPQHAFIDVNGDEVSGDIEIRYREFHDQLDILFSGIPMTYDSAGTTYNFESAGMLEIQGYQNGTPVYIKPEQPLEVRMQSNNPSPVFNLYNLDEGNEKWDYIGKDKIVIQEPEDGLADNLSMDEIMKKPELVKSQSKIDVLADETDVKLGEHQVSQKSVEQWTKKEPSKPNKINPNNNKFDLDVDAKQFPELTVYENVKFEVPSSDKSFTPDVYSINWPEAEVTEKEKGKIYNLKLTNGSDVRNFDVYPVFEGASYTQAMQIFNSKFEKYNQQLQKRTKLEKEKKALYQSKLSEWEKARAEQAILVAQYRSETGFNGGGEDGKPKERVSTRTKIARVFAVFTFGIWNADCTIPARPKGQKVMAKFVDERSEPVLLSHIQLIERSRNSVYNIASTEFDKLKWDPSEDNVFVGVTPTGRVGYVNSEYIKSIPEGEKRHTFKLKMLDGRSMSPEELRRQINI
jgi:hypothetical protein